MISCAAWPGGSRTMWTRSAWKFWVRMKSHDLDGGWVWLDRPPAPPVVNDEPLDQSAVEYRPGTDSRPPDQRCADRVDDNIGPADPILRVRPMDCVGRRELRASLSGHDAMNVLAVGRVYQ